MQLEIDIAEYILNHPEYCTEEVPRLVKECLVFSPQSNQFQEEFNHQYTELSLIFIRNYITVCFSLNSEDATVIITKDFIEQLLGKDYFKYEYKN